MEEIFPMARYLAKGTVKSYLSNDPEPDVPKDVTPMAQCAFESLMFNVSAVYTN